MPNSVHTVAHDFNNLLTILLAIADGLRRATTGVDRARLLEELDETLTRAGLMTSQLLGRGPVEPAELVAVDLSEQVRLLERLLPRLLGPRIEVDLRLAPGAMVRATRGGLEQVLLNLAANARHAMPFGGKLELSVRCEETSVSLKVKDSGIGMTEATRAQIFTPYFTTRKNGTGIGLARVHEQITAFGGTIDVVSAPGEGTTFEIRFPRVASS